jgi:hypothetical protein
MNNSNGEPASIDNFSGPVSQKIIQNPFCILTGDSLNYDITYSLNYNSSNKSISIFGRKNTGSNGVLSGYFKTYNNNCLGYNNNNTDRGWDSNTGKYFAPCAGIYLISGSIYCTSWVAGTYWLLDGTYYAQEYPFSGFQNNISSQKLASISTDGSGILILPFTATIYMKTGSYFWIRLIGSPSSSKNTIIQYGGNSLLIPENCTYANGGNTSSNLSIVCLIPLSNNWY